jgi:hypothetical protein
MIGRYEQLNEQPEAAASDIPFLCLTDDPDLRSETWQIRHVSPVFGMDPIRSQRDLKIRPHVHLPDFDSSLYIDNTVLLTVPPERLFERDFVSSGFSLPHHSGRSTTLDEFLEVSRLGLDDQGRIFEQLNHYTVDCPEVLEEKPYWTAILLRDHRSSAVQTMSEIWAAHVHRYSRRDQLSVNIAFRRACLTPDVMEIDNQCSWFHTWPHIREREREKGMRLPSASFSPPGARIRQLEQRLSEQAQQHEKVLFEQAQQREALLASPSWRVARAISRCARYFPRLARFGWRGLRLSWWLVALQLHRRLPEVLSRWKQATRSWFVQRHLPRKH